MSPLRPEFDTGPVLVSLWLTKCHWHRISPVSIIVPLLQTRLHLSTTLIRGKTWQSLGNFRQARFVSLVSGSTGEKSTFIFELITINNAAVKLHATSILDIQIFILKFYSFIYQRLQLYNCNVWKIFSSLKWMIKSLNKSLVNTATIQMVIRQ